MLKARLAVLALAVLTGPLAAQAQEAAHGGYEELGKSRDWTAIRFVSPAGNGATSCAIFSRPKTSQVVEGEAVVNALRGEKAAFVTWEADVKVSAQTGVLSFLVGAPVVPMDAGHEISVDGKNSFIAYGHEDRVYVHEDDDAEVIRSIRGGRELSVKVKISDTRVAEDSYSLYGVQAATRIAAQACN